MYRSYLKKEYKDRDGAIRDLRSITRFDPKNAEVFFRLSILYLEVYKYQAAMVNISKAIGINPVEASYLTHRGNLFLIGKQYREAMDDLNEAIGLDPLFSCAYTFRAKVREANGDMAGAEEDRQTAAELKEIE